MNTTPADPLDRFLRATHRRMTLLRALERVGLALLVGCAASLALSPVLIFRGSPTGALSIALVGLTGLAGLAWALANPPRRLAAAAEADRQLRLADLLSTAATLPPDSTDPFARSVRALAGARCAQLTPDALILHRLGARGWGGIGLALAAVLTVALMTADAPRTRARAAASATPRSWQDLEPAPGDPAPTAGGRTPDFRRPQTGLGTDDEDPLRTPETTPETAPTASARDRANGGTGRAADGGTGAGAAQSTAKPTPTDPLRTAAGAGRDDGPGRTTGGGGAGAATPRPDNSTSAGATAGPLAARRPAPVWRADAWPADRDAARAALRAGQIPDRHRDLVRDYFDRD